MGSCSSSEICRDVGCLCGETPLHMATRSGCVVAVALLLRSGASVEAKTDVFSETALHKAAKFGRAAVVDQLLSAGATMDAVDKNGEMPLHLAAGNGHAAVVDRLISAGATVDAVNCWGVTALHRAVEDGHAAVVEPLISAGATMDAVDSSGLTPLHVAAGKGRAAMVELLICAGATVDAVDQNGQMPLHGAALNGHAAVVDRLISAGATVDAVDRNGRTPLHRAAGNGRAAMVELLISVGATVDAVNKYGETPYDRAKNYGHPQVMGLLRPVFVALLSGRSCRCNSSQSRTVLELKEEAEKKLGVKIKHIIGQDHKPLDESMELAAAQIVPGSTLTAVISAEEIEEAHPEAQAPAQAMPEDSFEMKDFEQGIRLMALQSIFDEFSPKVEVLENWSDLKNVSVLEQVLPAGHVPLSRLLRLTPEDRTFPVPVEVQAPTCAGADTVWRSTSAGWEKVDTVTFDDGRATVLLDHFCDLAITGKCIPLKGLGFVHPEGTNAQIVIMHIGCESCQRGLELLCSDEDVLQPLRRCGPSLQLGTFKHNEELEIQQAGRTSKVRMRFDKMPLSRRLHAQSGLHFDVDIDGENHCFEAPLVPGPTTPAPQPAPHVSSGHPAGSASQAPAVARGAVGSSGLPNPGVASTDGHLMLSGRFNRDEIVAYMKEVKSQLETRNVPVFMVNASVGQNFGHMTRQGLCRAKGMVAFCTSEYGAYTGVGYETFHELEFAHENELPLFPIRLSELWPPAPQNNERGTHQNRLVFKKSLVFAEDRQMTNARGVADQIAESVARMGIFRN